MQPPAIQAALDNLVEVIRTALMAEFLELLRGEKKPVALKGARKGGRKAPKTPPKSRASKSSKARRKP